MKNVSVVLLIIHAIVASAESLDQRRPSQHIEGTHLSAREVEVGTHLSINYPLKTSAQHSGLNNAFLATRKASKVVWFLGNSIDRLSTTQACQNASAVVKTLDPARVSAVAQSQGLARVPTRSLKTIGSTNPIWIMFPCIPRVSLCCMDSMNSLDAMDIQRISE